MFCVVYIYVNAHNVEPDSQIKPSWEVQQKNVNLHLEMDHVKKKHQLSLPELEYFWIYTTDELFR